MRPPVRRLVAHLALLTFIGVIGLSGFDGHSGFDDDRACGDRGLYVSREAAALHDAVPVPTPEHCALCHLQRAASGASPATPVTVLSTLVPLSTPSLDREAVVRGGAPAARSSRAPPVSPA